MGAREAGRQLSLGCRHIIFAATVREICGQPHISRDHRPDCVQVVIALVITPQGFPLAYEVLAGNTADNTTLKEFLARIEQQYGKARRVWLMDRGIPTGEVPEQRRRDEPTL